MQGLEKGLNNFSCGDMFSAPYTFFAIVLYVRFVAPERV